MDQLSLLVKSRPLVLVTILFSLGIILGMVAPLPLWVYLMSLSVAFGLVWLIPGRFRPYLDQLLIILLGVLRLSLHEQIQPNDLRTIPFMESRSYAVSAVIRSVSETQRGTPKIIIEPYLIDEHPIDNGQILLFAKDLQEVPDPGDTLHVSLQVEPPALRRNPHDFDYRSFLAQQDIYFQSFLKEEAQMQLRKKTGLKSALYMEQLRTAIQRQFFTYCDLRSAGILSALILGDRSEVDEETRNDFANTGVIHVLAVSGLHVGYVTLILVALSGFLRLPSKLRSISVICGLGFYVLLTGSAPSVMRAALMGSLVVVGSMLERKTDVFNTLSAAAFIMLMISPDQISNIGFQLSFSAVLSIVLIFPILQSWCGGMIFYLPLRLQPIFKPVLDLFLVSLAAQVGTLPLTLYYFQKLPIISLIANLFVVPLIGLIVALGLAFLLLGWILPFFAQSWGALLDVLIAGMLFLVQYFGGISWAYLTTPRLSTVDLTLLWLTLLSLFFFSSGRGFRIAAVWLLIWLNLTMWNRVVKPMELELVVLDVGQGDAILVHTPKGKTLLIDSGSRFGGQDMGEDVIAPYLRYRNWDQIDLMVLTHPHNDHIGGAESLIGQGLVAKVYMPDIHYESYGYEKLKAAIAQQGIPVESPHSGHIDSSLAPLFLRVIAPRTVMGDEPANINNSSLVLQAFYGNTSLFLPGDAEEQVESYEKAYGHLLRSDVLKSPHHGSRTSSTDEFLDLVSPRICVISVGEKNKFRHPATKTIAAYETREFDIMRTDFQGAVILGSDGNRWRQYNWRK